MERAGINRRLPAFIFDVIFAVIFAVIAVAVYAAVGGAQLGLRVHDALGIEMQWSSAFDEQVYEQYELRAEDMIAEIETEIRADFTDEQAEFIANELGESISSYFVPDQFSLRYFLDIDENDIDEAIDRAFDDVIAAERADISAADVNELRDRVKAMVDEFAIGRILPVVVDFIIWLIVMPILVFLVYWLSEAFFGRTLGKLIMGIRVMSADGERAYLGSYMLRYLVKNLPLVLLIVGLATRTVALMSVSAVAFVVVLIGGMAMVGREKRALHDIVTNTAVYRTGGPVSW